MAGFPCKLGLKIGTKGTWEDDNSVRTSCNKTDADQFNQ